MKVTEACFFQEFIDSCDLCCRLGWNERNGGNMSYRIKKEDVESVKESFSFDRPWTPIGVSVPNLAGELFMVTGSGKYFRYTKADPENSVAITEIDDKGIEEGAAELDAAIAKHFKDEKQMEAVQ